MTRADLLIGDLEPIDFEALIAEVEDSARLTFGDHDVAIETEINTHASHQLPRIRLLQIIENLVTNGIKYRKPDIDDSFVRIEVRDQPSLTITVRDNGLGIPREFHPRAFRMFERFHSKASTVGSGLGLAIVKKHVDRLSGDIELESSPEGTTITIRLPTQKATQKATQKGTRS